MWFVRKGLLFFLWNAKIELDSRLINVHGYGCGRLNSGIIECRFLAVTASERVINNFQKMKILGAEY